VNGFEKYIPALLTIASIDLNLVMATSAIFVTVAGSAMFPSTKPAYLIPLKHPNVPRIRHDVIAAI
jgi:hypothetical protein